MARKILIRLLALTAIVCALNLVYTYTLYQTDMEQHCIQVVEMKAAQPGTDIFYLAESSNFNTAPGDSIENSISEICNFFFPKLKIFAMNKPAAHAGVFKYWLRSMSKEHLPQAVVVTLNLRSFDAMWIHSSLETALQQSVMLLKPYPKLVNRFLLSLNAFDDKTPKQREQLMLSDWKKTPLVFPFDFRYKTVREWDDATAQGAHLKADGSWDYDKILLTCHYIKGYAFNLNEENPRIKDFDDIVKWSEETGVKLYLNLMAENLQYADSLVGKELVYLMKSNRDFLLRRYNKGNCRVVDNLELVPGKEFTDQNWTTEHYNYRGRMRIAKNLAEALKEQLPSHYRKAY